MFSRAYLVRHIRAVGPVAHWRELDLLDLFVDDLAPAVPFGLVH